MDMRLCLRLGVLRINDRLDVHYFVYQNAVALLDVGNTLLIVADLVLSIHLSYN